MLTLPVIRRQESTPQNLRGGPASAAAGPQAGTQAPYQRKLLAYQQPGSRSTLASALPTTPTWKVNAGRLLLGHGHTGQCSLLCTYVPKVCNSRKFERNLLKVIKDVISRNRRASNPQGHVYLLCAMLKCLSDIVPPDKEVTSEPRSAIVGVFCFSWQSSV